MEVSKLFQANLDEIHPYNPKPLPKELEDRFRDRGGIFNFAANENPWGPAPAVKNFFEEATQLLHRYPTSGQSHLKQAIANHYNLSSDWVHLGSGIEEILSHASRLLLQPGDSTLLSQATFPLYFANNQLQQARQEILPLNEGYQYDLTAMGDALRPGLKLIYLCNPNNPTGTIFSRESLLQFVGRIPDEPAILLDEAYFEYVLDPDYPDGAQLLDEIPNLIVCRTFSKAYGLAGFRIGYSLQNPELTKGLDKFKPLHSLNGFVEESAILALRDQDHLEKVIAQTHTALDRLKSGLETMGLEVFNHHANFLFATTQLDTARIASEMLEKFGFLISPLHPFGIPEGLRISPGTSEQNQLFLDSMEKVIQFLGES